ncbi:multidrug effflux MFS transporter [Thalassobium sp. R2A62]|uniref:multidrug effflux MFS transporter n=1 Tax=Thalassobium sp. R2A62 TaxID=633131 RepID=UPI0001B1D303|nr:drug resistance transporter, Bcr/CflA subfamily [Thalassobium sp. R2A62]
MAMEKPLKRLRQSEFVALMAMLSATVAFSIDAMLPAMPEIAQDLTPDAPNRVGLIITSFVLGMGLGTFFTGPLSDAYGRKPVMIGGAAVYILSCLFAFFAESFEAVLASRVLMGLGAAGPRVVAMATIRDLYAGRNMARITSFIMIVFTLVPAIAPTIGAGIIALSGWRGIFLAFIVFSAISVVWLMLRQPETHPAEKRNPVNLSALWAGAAEMFAHPTARLSIMIQSLTLGMLFSVLSSTQQIFDDVYGYGDTFHLWFGAIAVTAGTSGFLNAKWVVKHGMRALIKGMLSVQIFAAFSMVIALQLNLTETTEFAVYLIWTTSVFFQAGMTIGNLNALGMEPMGHIAGMAASLMSAISTIAAVFIAAPVSLAYDGTPLPTAVGILLCAIAGRYLTGKLRRDSDDVTD